MPIGRLRKGKTYLRKEEVEELALKDYGVAKRKYLVIDPLETLYLTFTDRIQVKKGRRILDFEELFKLFTREKPTIFTRFLIYRDLRDRGYIVKSGYGEKIDFLVYDRGDYPEKAAKYRIIGVDEGHPISVLELMDILRFTTMSKKELKIAVVERRGEVVYYSLKSFFGGRFRGGLGEED